MQNKSEKLYYNFFYRNNLNYNKYKNLHINKKWMKNKIQQISKLFS